MLLLFFFFILIFFGYYLFSNFSKQSSSFTSLPPQIFKAPFLLFGTWIAWQTRNVFIPALNDSKWIGISIYNISGVSLTFVPLIFILGDNVNAVFLVSSLSIIISITSILILLFFPKFYAMYKGLEKEWTDTMYTGKSKSAPSEKVSTVYLYLNVIHV